MALSEEEQARLDKVIGSLLGGKKPIPDEGTAEEAASPEGAVVIKIPSVEVTDIGEYCVDCRDPVDERYPKFASRRPVLREGEGEDGKALKGFLCEDCVPLEGTLMQPLVEALVERRWDEGVVKERMKVVGVEDIYEKVVGPTLDLLEVLLRLER